MSDVKSMVDEAQSQETFSFAEVVQGRGYPQDEVTLVLDEATAYQISKLEKQIASETDSKKADELAEGLVPLKEKLAKSKFVFKIRGISSELREELLKKAREDFKPEYDSNKNFITGQVEKVERDNPERDRYYTNLLWQASTEQIVAPNGAVDTAPDLSAFVSLRSAPLSQQRKFQDALNNLEVASEFFEVSSDDDFLAKP